MQTYKDTVEGKIYQFEDDVVVTETAGVYSFTTSHGMKLQLPTTLQPYVIPVPTAAELLAAAQTSQLAILSAACQSAIYGGFTSSALGAPYHYPAKDKDQMNLMASYAASFDPANPAGWTTPFWCADSTGAWALRPHTAVQIQQVGRDAKAAVTACIQKNESLAVQVMAATTVAAVQAVIW